MKWVFGLAILLFALIYSVYFCFQRLKRQPLHLYLYWRLKRWLKSPTPKTLQIKVLKGKYPVNLRYLDEKKKMMIVESLPGKRMVIIADRPVCLYFPYIYFIIEYSESQSEPLSETDPIKVRYTIRSFYVGFSAEQNFNTSEKIGKLPLSNYIGIFGICLGNSWPKPLVHDDLRTLSVNLINAYWKSSFQSASQSCQSWIEATKVGLGEYFVDKMITDLFPINHVVRNDDEFFEYQSDSEPEPVLREPTNEPEPSRSSPGRNRPNHRKKRKSSRR